MSPTIKFIEDRIAKLKQDFPDPQCYPTSYERRIAKIEECEHILEGVRLLSALEDRAIDLVRRIPTDLHPDDMYDGSACRCSQCELRRDAAALLSTIDTTKP